MTVDEYLTWVESPLRRALFRITTCIEILTSRHCSVAMWLRARRIRMRYDSRCKRNVLNANQKIAAGVYLAWVAAYGDKAWEMDTLDRSVERKGMRSAHG